MDLNVITTPGDPGCATITLRVRAWYDGAGAGTVKLKALDALTILGPMTRDLTFAKGEWCEIAFEVRGASGAHRVVAGAGQRIAVGHSHAVTDELEVILP
jgi:hypothetical protein